MRVTPSTLRMRPVRNSWMPSVRMFTRRSTVAKKSVRAALSLKALAAMPTCSKYRNVEVSENSSRNSAVLMR